MSKLSKLPHEMLLDNKFGDSGARVVIEEFPDGEEFLSLCLCQWGQVLHHADGSRITNGAYDGDMGPNTGGMGAYAPVPHLAQSVVDTAVDTIVKPVLEGMIKEKVVLILVSFMRGLFSTADGPKVIEFTLVLEIPKLRLSCLV